MNYFTSNVKNNIDADTVLVDKPKGLSNNDSKATSSPRPIYTTDQSPSSGTPATHLGPLSLILSQQKFSNNAGPVLGSRRASKTKSKKMSGRISGGQTEHALKVTYFSKALPANRVYMHVQARTVDQPINRIMKYTYTSWFTQSNVAEAKIATAFTLADFNGYASFQAVYDRYCIRWIRVSLVPSCMITANAAIGGNIGILASVVDCDDSVAISLSSMTERPNVVISQVGENLAHDHKFQPHVAAAVYNTGGVFTGYAVNGPTWIDCAYSGVQHYGFKAACQAGGFVQPFDLLVEASIDFAGGL